VNALESFQFLLWPLNLGTGVLDIELNYFVTVVQTWPKW